MRVVLAHTHYRQAGGEDQAFAAEADLLESAGHEVTRFEASNSELTGLSPARAALAVTWNGRERRRLGQLLERVQPDVVHFHNTFPWTSPAAYYAVHGQVAIVQTLHNYRLICPNALLFRNGAVCEACVGRVPVPGIRHGCYRSSRTATAAVVAMTQAHRLAGTWHQRVHAYIAATDYARELFVRGGMPAPRVHVKPNFVTPDPGPGPHDGSHYLFVGRLDEQKGLRVIIDAWRQLAAPPALRIIGSGPLENWLAEQITQLPAICWLGAQPHQRVLQEMQHARALIFPSLSHENCPMTVLEAFATGLPVLCSRTGNLERLVGHEFTGWLFDPGAAGQLAALITRADQESDALAALGRRGRTLWQMEYTAQANRARLEAIYHAARRLALAS